MTRLALVAATIACALAVAQAAQQQPPRDVQKPAVPATAVLSGSVLFEMPGDARPARGAIVNLKQVEGDFGATTVTDDQGRFVFADVPAGRYTLSSDRAGFVRASYGANRSGRDPTPIVVAAGQQITGLTLRLVKGAVLAGTVRGVDGEPAAGVRIGIFRVMNAGGIRRLVDFWDDNIGSHTTDYRGEYRIYGLAPGEYALRAIPGKGEDLPSAHVVTPEDLAWARGVLARPADTASAATPPPQNFVTYAPFYYPSSLKKSSATIIALGPGEERTGLDFQLSLIPTFTVAATIAGARTPSMDLRVFLVESGNEGGGWYDLREAYYPFSFDGVPPGTYTVAAITAKSKMWATATVAVSTQDQTVALTLQPGLTMSGQIAFRGRAPQPDPTKILVSLSAVATGVGLTIEPSSAKAAADGTFSVGGMMPAAYRLFATVPRGPSGATDWYLRSAMVGDQDIADYPLELRAGVDPGKVTVTFTDTPTELNGLLQDASGRAASDYFIIVFSPDERTWSERSRRIVQTRPASDGRFTVRGLPPGDYLVAALTDVERNEWHDPGFLRELVPATQKVTLGEAERRTLTLQIK